MASSSSLRTLNEALWDQPSDPEEFAASATVFGLLPSYRLSSANEACDRCIAARAACAPLGECQHSPVGQRDPGAPVTNLAHSASFHSIERIAPPRPGIKQDRNSDNCGSKIALNTPNWGNLKRHFCGDYIRHCHTTPHDPRSVTKSVTSMLLSIALGVSREGVIERPIASFFPDRGVLAT